MPHPVEEPRPAQPDLEPARVRTLLVILITAAFVVILNETVLSVALPDLMDELDIPAPTAQWLTTGFMLTMAVVIPTTGFVLQRFAHRRVFMAAMALFTLGTLLAMLAPGFPVLMVGRVIQACGTALMLPLLMTTVLNVIPVERRGSVMGLISVVISVAPAVGPTISGLILDSLSWRWLFAIMLPIALAALALGAWLMPAMGEQRRVGLDLISVPLSVLGILQYIAPIGQFILGVTVFGEHMPVGRWIGFGLIWLALIVFTTDHLAAARAQRRLLRRA